MFAFHCPHMTRDHYSRSPPAASGDPKTKKWMLEIRVFMPRILQTDKFIWYPMVDETIAISDPPVCF